MPTNLSGWLWYAYFFCGAAGGWVLIGMFLVELVRIRARRK